MFDGIPPANYQEYVDHLVNHKGEKGAVLVVTGDERTDVHGSVEPGTDARWASLWMLGAYIHHVAESAQESGGDLTMDEAAEWAVQYFRENQP